MTGTTEDKNSTNKEGTSKKTLSLTKTLELKKIVERDQVRQSFSHGRSKTVEVEVKRKRLPISEKSIEKNFNKLPTEETTAKRLSEAELEARLKAVQKALKDEESQQELKDQISIIETEDSTINTSINTLSSEKELILHKQEPISSEKNDKTDQKNDSSLQDNSQQYEQIPLKKFEKKASPKEEFKPIILRAASYGPVKGKTDPKKPLTEQENQKAPSSVVSSNKSTIKKIEEHVPPSSIKSSASQSEDGNDEVNGRRKTNLSRIEPKKAATPVKKGAYESARKLNRNILTKALDDNLDAPTRSVAALKRARQKHKLQQYEAETVKVVRDVTIPETISVGELASRMAVRGAEVVKALMKLGMMVTINQLIDGDTAELICTEFGHKCKRVSDADIELGIEGAEDKPEDMIMRAPIVTIMGHVDHGKTSLLDALRKTDVVSGEAGGITQHIGAYQVTMHSGQKITFIDTPGHAAFSEMRARGANVTDIVVLVVAADDGIKEQTIEAINHATAAKVPIVVAINKIDKPDANPDRVRNELLTQGIVLEEYGGDIMAVEVSAKNATGLQKLEETILLQAEVLDLKANPNRQANGVIVEAKMDKGRGAVSTVLIQRGTLRVGDIFVAGTEFGRVRALVNDHGMAIQSGFPSMPVEILGFNGIPSAGDEFFVVESESKAREITDYRQHHKREKRAVASARGSMEQMMSQIAAGEAKELSLVIKADVQGSLEALKASLEKLSTTEVTARILHGAVGGINESDVTLARASNGIIIGFNVRANPQAREIARRDNVDIRYYSIIYNVLDDMKLMMGGLLAPTLHEKFLGFVQIREVFSISKIGKVAGCFVTEGTVKRGSKVRLLRDNVVIHEGDLKSLKRFKDEVKEVKESYECGIVLENYNDIRVGDVIECFEFESIARQL